jgi:hypothetical protein
MRSALALFIAAAACVPHLPATAASVRVAITVRVYQTAGLPSALEQRALTQAGTVLGAALVDVTWRRCTAPTPSPQCARPPVPSERSLRIVRERALRQARSITLGTAFVDPRAGGVLATVYFDQVARLARETGTDVAVLLGRAVAHELAHLLMRTTTHPRCGVMRPNWTQSELRRNRAVDWAFTAGDVVAMHPPRVSGGTR